VWIEADPRKAEASKTFAGPKVYVLAAAVRRDNVVRSLHAAGVPPAPDLLVLDIDGNDWWVLDASLHEFHPRVVVVEYDATFQPGQWWVQRYRADRTWDGTFRHGASLDALTDLTRSSGFMLVAYDSHGVNAFFVESGAASTTDAAALGDVGYHYVRPWFSSSVWGHPRVRSDGQAIFAMDRERARSRVDHPTETCGVERPRRARRAGHRACVRRQPVAGNTAERRPGARSSGPLLERAGRSRRGVA
jgi:hypothetical protein